MWSVISHLWSVTLLSFDVLALPTSLISTFNCSWFRFNVIFREFLVCFLSGKLFSEDLFHVMTQVSLPYLLF